MKKLSEIIDSSDSLAEGLMDNATKHINYKIYTSMEKALLFFLTGELYFSSGSNWNDKIDRQQMENTKAFAMCTSFSTKENVAMWMLYGNRLGKNGAVLNLTKTIIKDILSVETIELVKVKKGELDNVVKVLDKNNGDFSVFATDVIYTSDIVKDKEGTVISCYGANETVNSALVNDRRIFKKKYEWKYENECRLVINVSDDVINKINELQVGNKDSSYLAIKVRVADYKKIKRDRLIRSPIYDGTISYGEKSELTGEIDWNISSIGG